MTKVTLLQALSAAWRKRARSTIGASAIQTKIGYAILACADELDDALSALGQDGAERDRGQTHGWQPIATAPHDGTPLLLGGMHPDSGFGFIYDVGSFTEIAPGLPWNWGWNFPPTVWMHLPPPQEQD